MRFPVRSLLFAMAMGWATSASAADEDKLKNGPSDASVARSTVQSPSDSSASTAPRLRLTADVA